MKKLLMACGASLILSGCSVVAVSGKGTLAGVDVKGADGRADRTLCVSNEGCWIFNSFPLCSTSLDWDEQKQGVGPYAVSFFTDDTALARVSDVFYRVAEREGCDVVDIVVDNRTKYPIGFWGLGDLVGTVFSVREVAVTGVLKERK